jgi:hypothetical protein
MKGRAKMDSKLVQECNLCYIWRTLPGGKNTVVTSEEAGAGHIHKGRCIVPER